MRLELPFVVAQPSPRAYEVWMPRLGLAARGPSLAELRDELALAVMAAFEHAPPAMWARFQLPPHLRLRHVDVKLTHKDRKKNKTITIAGRYAVMLEKWPADSFWIALPTRIPVAEFAITEPDALEQALPRRLLRFALDEDEENLDAWVSAKRERLDVLEVDAYPPSILPRGRPPAPRPARPTRKKAATGATAAAETPAEKEERRRRRRLAAVALRAAAQNLSHAASDDTLGRCFGREALVETVCDQLFGRDGAAIVLVGPSGAGKSAVVHEVVRRLGQRHGAAGVRRDFWRLDGGRFIAGQSYVGQWEARARDLTSELVDTGDVLFADDLASLCFAGRAGKARTNLAQVLEPALLRGEVSILGECTPERWALVREEQPAFAGAFRVVPVPALTAKDTLPVLIGVLRELESEAGAGAPPRLTPAALETVLDGAGRFRPHEAHPGKAVRLVRRLAAGPGVLEHGARWFDVEAVHAVLGAETGLPPFVIGAAAPRPRSEIRADLAGHVAGQPEAIDALVDVVLAMQAGLGDPGKPLASLLLVGPTGVGKTETAKALARYLFGSDERLLRFDMSELTSTAAIARLVGTAGGEPGELTTALRAQPLRVILFDEIEKAHPRVFDALLQLLGEGRLSDASGHTADARQAVILLTSNLGVREAAARTGFVPDGDEARTHYLAAARSFFRPEFFNRLDRIVAYRPLDRAALRVVVEHALAELLSRRGIERARVMVDVEPELLDLLVEETHDPRYGARPLKRALERRLTVPLAHHLATRRGDDLALVELYRSGSQLALRVRLLADAAATRETDGPATLGLSRLIAAAQTLTERVRALRAAPALQKLDAEFELRDALAVAEEHARELEDDEVLTGDFVGEVDDVGKVDLSRSHRRAGSSRPGHMGLRPRQSYREVPVAIDTEAALRRLRPRVAVLRDELALLEHRAAALAAGTRDQVTLLLECVGVPSGIALNKALFAVPWRLAGGTLWVETVDEAGRARWSERDDATVPVSMRRLAVSAEGPGVAAALEVAAGWILVDEPGEHGDREVLVHALLLPGDMPAAAAARDATRDAERAAQRAGAAPAGPPAPGVVVVRHGKHLATGLATVEHAAIVAAMLRARRKG